MHGPFHYGHGSFWWVGGLFGLLVVVAIVVGVVLIVRDLQRRGGTCLPPSPPVSVAIQELDLRYARGEIDRGDYLQRRADLSHGGAVPPPLSRPPGPQPPAPPPGPPAA